MKDTCLKLSIPTCWALFLFTMGLGNVKITSRTLLMQRMRSDSNEFLLVDEVADLAEFDNNHSCFPSALLCVHDHALLASHYTAMTDSVFSYKSTVVQLSTLSVSTA